MSSYKVTITREQEVVTPQQRGEYSILKKIYISGPEYENLDRDERIAWKAIDEGRQYEQVVYGYLEGQNTTKIESVTIYEQKTSKLDLVAVIKAVNEISECI